MGKKSKRRGGTGGGGKGRQGAGASGDADDQLELAAARAAVSPLPTGLDTPADALAFLETVPPLTSLKGIISTNDDPRKCALCYGPIVHGWDHATCGLAKFCCGKQFCDECHLSGNGGAGFALDLLGEDRCIFCNASKSCILSLSLQKATAGKAWAQYAEGNIHLHGKDSSMAASLWIIKAAANGHPAAFLKLSQLCRGKWGHPRDLKSSRAYAKKARSFDPALRLDSNWKLMVIAEEYLEDGAVEEVTGILSDIVKEADPNALDGDLCDRIAITAHNIEQHQLAGDMSARSFCHGAVEMALCAVDGYFLSENYALSKLWLSVAYKTKSGYDCAVEKTYGTVEQMGWSKCKQFRDEIRTELREIRNSCGGCGDALEGDTRKYCRGCMAFCYCSRECQKLHWNRADADGGHSTECKEAQDQARKILAAIQSGKVDLSIEEE